jgi:hypothetical protein
MLRGIDNVTTRVERALSRLALCAVVALAACGDSGPTGSTDVLPRAAAERELALSDPSTLEDFDCTHLESVRVRFSDPGYSEDDRVGLYVYFADLMEGPKRLRIWWDYENDGDHFQDYRFSDEATEIEEVYEHRYLGLREPTEMLVRVELIRDGLTGNCPRNRRILVSPPAGASGSAGPATRTAQVGPGIGSVSSYDYFSYYDGVAFTVLTPLTIDSVWVDPGAAGTLLITLYDGSGSNMLNSTSAGVSAGPQQVSVGFSLTPGTYLITLDGTNIGPPGVGATFGGANYPYQIPGVISLDSSGFGFPGWYLYLYDWQVTW